MKANFKKLSVRSLDYGASLIINVTHNNAQQEAKTHPVFLEVEKERNIFTPLVAKDHYTRMSDMLKKLNSEILTDIRGIKNFALGIVAIHSDADKVNAAQTILNAIKKGGKLYNQKTSELNSRITTVINEFAKPEVQAAFTALALTDAGNSLIEKKKRYDAGSVEHVDKKSEISQTENASTARPRLEEALKDYLALVTAMRKVSGWEDLYADINEVVKRMKRSIRENKELEDVSPEEPQE